MPDTNPKLFISYSWTTPEHEEWVVNLATDLRDNGIDVILDKWDLKEGHDAIAFMERMVSDPEIGKVALICDRMYAEKADGRSGGVGTETQIISPEVYAKEDQEKFVAILAERDEEGRVYLPTYYRSRVYIDLSDTDLFASNFEQLLRWIYDKPLYIKPDLGQKPRFLEDTGDGVSLGTSAKARRALDGIRNNRDYWKGAVSEYFDTFSDNLERFRLTKSDVEFDDQVFESIDQFLPYRNEAIAIFLALAQYQDSVDSRQAIHRFLESLLPYLHRPDQITSWSQWDSDNFRFIVHELFLYAVASLLKYERFDSVGYLLRNRYYLGDNATRDSDGMVPFQLFREHAPSLVHRNQRLGLRRLSLRADLLDQRSHTSGLNMRQLMQADFTVYVRTCLDLVRETSNYGWWPETHVFIDRHESAFEIFARAQSKQYFKELAKVFDIESKDDFRPMFEAFKDGRLKLPSWEFTSFSPAVLLGYESLESRP